VYGEDLIADTYEEGAVQVMYGSRKGLLADGNQFWTQDSPGIPDSPEIGDGFGFSLAAGNLSGDRRDELVIGVPFEDYGAVQVLRGSAGGLTARRNQFLTASNLGLGDRAASEFGLALAVSDLGRSRYEDLAIGATGGPSSPTVWASGSVTLLYGSHPGLDRTGVQLWTQDTPGIHGEAQANDLFGRTLAIADFNGDHTGDLAVGAIGETVNGFPFAGAVQVILGTHAGLTARSNQFWTQDTPGIDDQAERGDAFGIIIAATAH
jgi:hypothetical protein